MASVKFIEGHGQGPRAGIVWDVEGENLITAGGDARLLVHSAASMSEARGGDPVAVADVLHQGAVTALCIAPKGHFLATASIDKTVKLYSYPGAKFESNVTRFTLPVRALEFSITGGLLAAAGDDDEIKLISTVDNSIARVLKGHDGPVLSLAFDPQNDILASVDSEGTVIYWSLASGVKLHSLKHAAPETDVDEPNRNEIAWHPSGDVLAVPGHHFDVAMYDRHTAEVRFRLKGAHSSIVGSLRWSPNGKYVATTGPDRKVMIWDTESKQDLRKLKVISQVSDLAWKPTGNALALIDVEGKFSVWNNPVPGDLASPADMDQAPAAVSRQELLKFMDDTQSDGKPDPGSDDEEDEDDTSDNIRIAGGPEILLEDGDEDRDGDGSDEEDDSKRDGGSKKVKFSRKAELLRELSLLRGTKDQKVQRAAAGEEAARRSTSQTCSCKPRPERQLAFQPGSTFHKPGRARFLAYSLLGCVTSSESDGVYHVEVDFHDTSQGHRMPGMTDFNGYSVAALSKKGSVFASPRRDKSPSTLLYRPCTSSAWNSEWSMRLPLSEEFRAVAIGDGWTAAATSLNYLRIFSETGLQRCILSLAGPVVTMAGYQQLLVIVTHLSDPLDGGDEVMEFVVLDVREQQRILTGPIPLTPGAKLSWLGFSESGTLSSHDSKGVLRTYSKLYDGCWMPVHSPPEQEQSTRENLWIVGLDTTQIFCVKCPTQEVEPQVNPKPVLSIVTFRMPLAHSDLAVADLENDLLCRTLFLSEARSRVDEEAAGKLEIGSDGYQIPQMEADLDRCLLRLMASACQGDKSARALELASMLSLQKSLEGAIRIVSSMHLSSLAEQLYKMLEKRRSCDVYDSAVGIAPRNAMARRDNNGTTPASRAQDSSQPTSFLPPRGRVGLQSIKTIPPVEPSVTSVKGCQSTETSTSEANNVGIRSIPLTAQAESKDLQRHASPSPSPAKPAADGAAMPSTALEGVSSSDPTLQSSDPFAKLPNPIAKSSNPFAKSLNPFAKSSPAATGKQNGGTHSDNGSVLSSLKKMQQEQQKKQKPVGKEAKGKKRKEKGSGTKSDDQAANGKKRTVKVGDPKPGRVSEAKKDAEQNVAE